MANEDQDRDRGDDQVPLTSPPRKPAPPDPPAEDRDPEELRAELARLRDALKRKTDEDARKKRRLDELEKAEAEKRDAGLGEAERAARDRAESERKLAEAEAREARKDEQLNEMRLERLVEAEARRCRVGNAEGFENPELAYRLIDRTRVRMDEDGQWAGVKDAVETLAKSYQNLLRQKVRGPGSPVRDEHPGNPARRPNGKFGPAEPANAYEAALQAFQIDRM